jgi:YidC/Oxa1 family membrane protein insertase
MERRVLFAIFLAFLVLYVWQALFVKPVPKPGAATQQAQQAQQSQSAGGATTSAPANGVNAAPAGTSPASLLAEAPAGAEATAAATLVGEKERRDIRVETRSVIAVFTNSGARLKSWRLKRYLDHQNPPQPQELVEIAPNQPLPFSLRTSDEKVNATVNGALYAVTGEPSGAISSPTDVRFEFRDAAGVHAVKEFHFDPDAYIVSIRAEVTSGDAPLTPAIVWGPAVGDVAEATRYTQKPEGLLYQNEKAQRLATKDLLKQSEFDGDFKFAGVDDNYFMTVALDLAASKVRYLPVSIAPPAPSKDPARELVAYEVQPRTPAQTRFFVGPKDFDVLNAINPDLTKAINFGMFTVIVVPLLKSLKWVNSFVGNYGFSIIILTILINVIMFPLRHKSVVSMRKMQEIQPEVKAIQDRYAKLKATDPAKQKMNQELMTLYRERGVNPAGGCIPMVLTMPVLIAMWALLSTAIELRGAPFIGWIHDLTAHDPLYITPVIMGASQLWQQRMTPSAGMDPAQQRMMLVMPVVFTVMFLWLPAGVAIYYAVTNLWGIGQQYLTNYLIGPAKVRTIRPPAERRVKQKPAASEERG